MTNFVDDVTQCTKPSTIIILYTINADRSMSLYMHIFCNAMDLHVDI